MKPEELLYAESHEWLAVEETGGKKIGTVGISAFAVEALTDLVYLETPRRRQDLRSGGCAGPG